VVSKRGGDYALVHGQHIKFITDSLLTDEVPTTIACSRPT
jgi:hypothetical protein